MQRSRPVRRGMPPRWVEPTSPCNVRRRRAAWVSLDCARVPRFPSLRRFPQGMFSAETSVLLDRWGASKESQAQCNNIADTASLGRAYRARRRADRDATISWVADFKNSTADALASDVRGPRKCLSWAFSATPLHAGIERILELRGPVTLRTSGHRRPRHFCEGVKRNEKQSSDIPFRCEP